MDRIFPSYSDFGFTCSHLYCLFSIDSCISNAIFDALIIGFFFFNMPVRSIPSPNHISLACPSVFSLKLFKNQKRSRLKTNCQSERTLPVLWLFIDCLASSA